MGRAVAPGSREEQVGMEVFYTDTPALGGRLRARAEDFVVEELEGAPPVREKGRFLAVKVRLVNWEHNHFIREATRALRLPRRNVGFAGTKDKRAVTTQWFTFLVSEDGASVVGRLESLNRVQVLAHHRTERSLRLGQHEGNRFHVAVREIPSTVDEARERLNATLGALAKIGGFPNFFGMQRFGTVRPITHLVGKAMVRGDLEGAVVAYVTGPTPHESPEWAEARSKVEKERDWTHAAQVLPEELKFERAVVHHLAGDPEDFAGALRALPSNLVLLFVHAYQSYLFNRILSERIRRGVPIEAPVEGDLVLPASGLDLLPGRDPVRVDGANQDKLARQVKRGRAVVTAPLYGFDTPLAEGGPGEIERKILDEEEVDAASFRLPLMPEANSRGLRRSILTPVTRLEWEVYGPGQMPLASLETGDAPDPGLRVPEGEAAAVLRFSLPRGAYATTLLREAIKAEDTSIY